MTWDPSVGKGVLVPFRLSFSMVENNISKVKAVRDMKAIFLRFKMFLFHFHSWKYIFPGKIYFFLTIVNHSTIFGFQEKQMLILFDIFAIHITDFLCFCYFITSLLFVQEWTSFRLFTLWCFSGARERAQQLAQFFPSNHFWRLTKACDSSARSIL